MVHNSAPVAFCTSSCHDGIDAKDGGAYVGYALRIRNSETLAVNESVSRGTSALPTVKHSSLEGGPIGERGRELH